MVMTVVVSPICSNLTNLSFLDMPAKFDKSCLIGTMFVISVNDNYRCTFATPALILSSISENYVTLLFSKDPILKIVEKSLEPNMLL